MSIDLLNNARVLYTYVTFLLLLDQMTQHMYYMSITITFPYAFDFIKTYRG